MNYIINFGDFVRKGSTKINVNFKEIQKGVSNYVNIVYGYRVTALNMLYPVRRNTE